MSWSCSIRAVDDEGSPIDGVGVTIVFSGIFRGSADEYTDSDGWAEFSFDHIDETYQTLSYIAIRGETVDTDVSVGDGETMSYTL